MSGGSGRRWAARSVSRMPRPKPVSTTSAPCSCATRAVWNAIEPSVSTPVISSRLPSSSMVPRSTRQPGSDQMPSTGVTGARYRAAPSGVVFRPQMRGCGRPRSGVQHSRAPRLHGHARRVVDDVGGAPNATVSRRCDQLVIERHQRRAYQRPRLVGDACLER